MKHSAWATGEKGWSQEDVREYEYGQLEQGNGKGNNGQGGGNPPATVPVDDWFCLFSCIVIVLFRNYYKKLKNA